jgi:hypothetical protein
VTRKYVDFAVGGIIAVLVILSFMFSVSVRHTPTRPDIPVCEADPLAHLQECLQP